MRGHPADGATPRRRRRRRSRRHRCRRRRRHHERGRGGGGGVHGWMWRCDVATLRRVARESRRRLELARLPQAPCAAARVRAGGGAAEACRLEPSTSPPPRRRARRRYKHGPRAEKVRLDGRRLCTSASRPWARPNQTLHRCLWFFRVRGLVVRSTPFPYSPCGRNTFPYSPSHPRHQEDPPKMRQ